MKKKRCRSDYSVPTTGRDTTTAQHRRLLAAPLVRSMRGLSLIGNNRTRRAVKEGIHMNVELTADALSAPSTEQEYWQPQIILDIWPPSNWITGVRHDSQPTNKPTLSGIYVHGSSFAVYEVVHN